MQMGPWGEAQILKFLRFLKFLTVRVREKKLKKNLAPASHDGGAKNEDIS